MNSTVAIASFHAKFMMCCGKTFQIATPCIFSTLNMHNLEYTRRKGRESDTRVIGNEDEWGGWFPVGVFWEAAVHLCLQRYECQKKNTLLYHMSWFCWFFPKFCSCLDFPVLTPRAVPDLCVGPSPKVKRQNICKLRTVHSVLSALQCCDASRLLHPLNLQQCLPKH